jgi:hypothetical protein
MILHILTAMTRPQNLPKMAESLIPAAAAGVELTWHFGYDVDRKHIAGQAVKNRLLDTITAPDDWVWILDDDNTAHPDFFRRLAETVAAKPERQDDRLHSNSSERALPVSEPGFAESVPYRCRPSRHQAGRGRPAPAARDLRGRQSMD